MPQIIKLLFFSVLALAQTAPVMKEIEIEWDEVPMADSYIVKLTPETAGQEPIYFTTKEAHIVEKVPVGVYELRIRSKSKEADVFSKWSEPTQLEVAVKEAKPLSPADKSVVEAKGKLNELIDFRWTPVDKVKEYTITIWTNEIKDKPYQFTTKETHKMLTVKTGRDYFWQVRFESANDISYAQLPPIFTFTLVGPKLIKPADIKITRAENGQMLSWKPAQDAVEYRAKLSFRFLDEKDYRLLKEFSVRNFQWNAGDLRPGAYKLELSARAPSRVDSDPSVLEFVVKPTEAQLMRR